MHIKKILAAFSFFGVLSLSACTQDSAGADKDCLPEWDFDTVEDGKLVIATVGTLPYVDIEPSQTEASGIDGDFYTEFARKACLVPEFRSLGGPAAVAAMTKGQADVGAGGWYATPERAESIGQTSAVWFNHNSIVSETGLDSIEDLQDKTVGVVGGSVYVEPLEKAISADNVRQYQSADAILRDLSAGRIDAAVGSAVEMGHQVDEQGRDDLQVVLLDEDPDHPGLTQRGSVNFPHTKDNAELGQALEAYIKEIQGDGTVAAVLSAYGADDPRYTAE